MASKIKAALLPMYAELYDRTMPAARRRCESFLAEVQARLLEREIDLLRYLATNAGRAVSREEILSRVWGINPHGVTTRTIDMHVARLREKLRDRPDQPRVLLTVRGKGYKLATPGGAA